MRFICRLCSECAHFGDCMHENICADSGDCCESCMFQCDQFEADDPSYWDDE